MSFSGGRGQEVPGEDPRLNSQYAEQYIRGLQYDDALYPNKLKAVSTAKHFQAYDCENCRALGDSCMPNSNHSCSTDRTKFNALVSKQDQVEYYWPAWKAAAGAGVRSVMCSCESPPPSYPSSREPRGTMQCSADAC